MQALAKHMVVGEPSDDLQLKKLKELLKSGTASHAHRSIRDMTWSSKHWGDAEFLIRSIWGNPAWIRGLADHLEIGVQVSALFKYIVIMYRLLSAYI